MAEEKFTKAFVKIMQEQLFEDITEYMKSIGFESQFRYLPASQERVNQVLFLRKISHRFFYFVRDRIIKPIKTAEFVDGSLWFYFRGENGKIETEICFTPVKDPDRNFITYTFYDKEVSVSKGIDLNSDWRKKLLVNICSVNRSFAKKFRNEEIEKILA